MRRIDGEGGQHREDTVQEIILEPRPLVPGEIRPVDQHDPGLRQLLAQLPPPRLLIAGEHGHGLANASELLARREPVRALGSDAGPHLALQAGDANHEEFVEVVGADRKEAHPLEQRMALVRRLLQDPAVEQKPGQFAIDEPGGISRELEFRDGRRGDGEPLATRRQRLRR